MREIAVAAAIAIGSAAAQGRISASDGKVKLPAAGETQATAFVTVVTTDIDVTLKLQAVVRKE